jgi:hypothetical protein
MYSYALLEPECYYLVQEREDESLTLLQVRVETDNCMFIVKYGEETVTEWKRKSDSIYDIIELLSDEAVQDWRKVYYDNEDAYYEEDDE